MQANDPFAAQDIPKKRVSALNQKFNDFAMNLGIQKEKY
jgi:hypothetical protein